MPYILYSTGNIPVLAVTEDNIPRAWESSLNVLMRDGVEFKTEYDREGDPPSKDCTMLLTVRNPLAEPMIHRDMPGGIEDLQEYTMEVCDGIKNHWVRDPNDPKDTRWEYTYNGRFTQYETIVSRGEGNALVRTNQLYEMAHKLAKAPHSRRVQAITWQVLEDSACYDPPCLQSIWCRILPNSHGEWVLNMNLRIRSNDAYKAAFMNMYAFIRLQQKIATMVAEIANRPVLVGRYCHLADSYHIYGRDLVEFNYRFMKALSERTFKERTYNYNGVNGVKTEMDAAIPGILEKASGR
jgi:thymidylate synthase